MTFTLYKSSDCTGTAQYTLSNVALSGTASGSTAGTNNQTTFAINSANAGTYSWKAVYSGDSTHKDVTTACTVNNVETSTLTINNGTSTTSS